MKLKILAAAVAAAALPVLAQTTTTAPVEPRQARVEVADPGATATAPKKASRATKAKSGKTARKTARKKARKKPQAAGRSQ